jgi:hypothetical protein
MTWEIKPSDRLFFDRYEYALSFFLPGVSCVKGLNDTYTERHLAWRRRSNFDNLDLYENSIQTLLKMLQTHRDEIKLVLYRDQAYVYSNNRGLLDLIANLRFVRRVTKTQAEICLPRDTVLLRNAKNKLRTYLREQRMDHGDQQRLTRFLETHGQTFRLSPALEERLHAQYFYVARYHFLDHDDVRDLMMLQLAFPGLVRKTVSIQAK